MQKPVLFLTIGLPGSGKSTYFSKKPNLNIVCADSIRGEFFGDEGIQFSDDFLSSKGYDPSSLSYAEKFRICNTLVWNEAKARAVKLLKEGKNVGYDGTQLKRRDRIDNITFFSPYALIHGIYFRIPVEVCIERDRKRKRQLGEKLIRELFGHFEIPSFEEGFDFLETIDENSQRISLMKR